MRKSLVACVVAGAVAASRGEESVTLGRAPIHWPSVTKPPPHRGLELVLDRLAEREMHQFIRTTARRVRELTQRITGLREYRMPWYRYHARQ